MKGVIERQHFFDSNVKDMVAFRPNYHGHIFLFTEESSKSALESLIRNHIAIKNIMASYKISYFDQEDPWREWIYIHKDESINEYQTKTYYYNPVDEPTGKEIDIYNDKYMEEKAIIVWKYSESRLQLYDDEEKNKKDRELFDDQRRPSWNAIITTRNYFRYYNIRFYGTYFLKNGTLLTPEQLIYVLKKDIIFEYHWNCREKSYIKLLQNHQEYSIWLK